MNYAHCVHMVFCDKEMYLYMEASNSFETQRSTIQETQRISSQANVCKQRVDISSNCSILEY